jgi:hypothetical protein
MSTDTETQPSAIEHLVAALKKCIEAEPDETAFALLGETLFAAVKGVLSSAS